MKIILVDDLQWSLLNLLNLLNEGQAVLLAFYSDNVLNEDSACFKTSLDSQGKIFAMFPAINPMQLVLINSLLF